MWYTSSRKKKLLVTCYQYSTWLDYRLQRVQCSTGDCCQLSRSIGVNVWYVVKEYTLPFLFLIFIYKTSTPVPGTTFFFVIFFSAEQYFRDGFHLYNSPLYNSSSSSYMSSYNATFVFISVSTSIPNSLNASLNASSSSATPKS